MKKRDILSYALGVLFLLFSFFFLTDSSGFSMFVGGFMFVTALALLIDPTRRKRAAEKSTERKLTAEKKARKRRRLEAMDRLTASELADRVAIIFQRGYNAQIDVKKVKKDRYLLNILTGNEHKFLVMVARTFKGIGVAEIRDFYGEVMKANAKRGYFFCNEDFTRQAVEWANEKPIQLVDQKGFEYLANKYDVKL